MNIKLDNVGKRFQRNWIFRNLTHSFVAGKNYVVLGPNGSGKSTLLKLISASLSPTEGTVQYTNGSGEVKIDNVYHQVAIAAPYLDLPEEYTLEELITFHNTFKSFEKGLAAKDIPELMELSHTKEKAYRHFSSGMKQRVKLGLAILSTSPLLLLDEPTTALDAKAIAWYKSLIENYTKEKTVIVFSNNKVEEYSFCEEKLTIGT